jgi:murein L,D-transpeptidase YafK
MLLNISYADLVNLYRTQGIEAVKAQLEEVLKQEQYWEDFLKNKDISLGYYESKRYLIFCEKNNKKLTLYKKENDGFTKVLDESVILGEMMGDKRVEGDKKTPEGVYDLTSKITKLDSFYGPLALVTSYPNQFDKSLKKNGHGIWIHGMPLNKEREDYTKGCIALDNPELQNLDKNINVKKSVVVISNEDIQNVSKEEMTRIFAFIYQWRDAWKRSNIQEYISFYSKEFKKANGANYEDFKKYKARIFSRNEDKLIQFSNINIMPYPNSLNKHMYKIVMDQVYKTKNYTFEGKKELYIELAENKIAILSEG